MKLKAKAVAVALAVTMAVSLLQYPAVTVRADEIPQAAEDAIVESSKTTDVTAGENMFDGTQDQEKSESQPSINKCDLDTDSPEDDAVEDDGNNTLPDENNGEKDEVDENDNLEGDDGNTTDDVGTENNEIHPDAEQNPDIIQDGTETDIEAETTEGEVANDVGIATAVADISGTCGENVTWTHNAETEILTISGTGDMQYYYSDVTHNNRPYPSAYVTSIIISDGVTGIAMRAFARFSDLVNVVIADSVTSIDSEAFSTCSKLTSIIIPNSVTNIGSGIFEDCRSLEDVVLSNKITSIPSSTFSACRSLKTILIPDSVTSIGIGAFSGCTSLINIQIPKGVTSIERDVFSGCNNLIDISVDAENLEFSSKEGVLFNRDQTALILYPEGKTEVDYRIPSGVATVISGAFSNCDNLKSVVIPKSITAIERGAFISTKNTILNDVYYEGSEDEWNSILIESGNTCLTDATIHYNSTGPDNGGDPVDPPKPPVNPPVTQDDPTLIVQGRTFEFTDPGSVELNWGWNYILNRDSSGYINDVAAVALALSAATERSQNAIESMLASDNLGADFITSKNYNMDSIEEINNPACTFAHKAVNNGGKTEHIIIIVGRGTSTDADLITDALSLGDHFREPASNMWRSFLGWLDTNGLADKINSSNTKFFVTGHSLGGAVANRVAYRLSQDYGNENVYAYTFASPPTEGQDSTAAPNIFNLLCKGDPVPYLGACTDGRYGTELWFADSCRIPPGFPYLGFLDNHVVESYMKHLLDISNYRFRTAVKSGGVRCPVDLRIYNSSGQLVGSVTNNTIDEENMTDSVMIVLSGENNDEKNFYFLTDDTYTIEFTGTGDGTLTYVVRDTYADKSAIIEKRYANVNLYAGKRMTSIVSAWDIGDASVDTSGLVSTPDTRLLVLDDSGTPVKEVLADDNGTEIPIGTSDNPGNEPGDNPGSNTGGNASGGNAGSRPGHNFSDNTPANQDGNGDGMRTSYSKSSGVKASAEVWKPTTPDEKKRYACMGKDAVQYTLPKDNAYRIIIENTMQGPLCFKSFETVLGDYKIGRTYNIYTLPDTAYSMDKEIQFTIKIPSDIYKKDREYKMICVTKDGQPIVYNDLDTNPETITVKTNKFYAYALIYR